jgi:cobalt transporter subunit CbtA
MVVALWSGAIAGFVLFALQHWTVVPLLERAETYEAAAHPVMPGMAHESDGWQPEDGFERTAFTALSTTLAGIGFSAVLFGAVALSGRAVDLRRGALWGLAGFACFVLAPALGMLPQPPGGTVADLQARQVWWLGTAVATATGLWLLLTETGRPAPRWLIGAACLALPQVIGAPATTEPSVVPAELAREFAIASMATSAVFWVLLGSLGGFLYSRRGVLAAGDLRGGDRKASPIHFGQE